METRSFCIKDILKMTDEYLNKKGISNSRLEAEVLLGNVTGMSRVELYVNFDRPVADEEKSAYRKAISKRVNGEPLQHIVGLQPFRHINLKVKPEVFIPRPETELVVERILEISRQLSGRLKIIDIGTGSGAIALSLAYEILDSYIYAVDISETALDLARENALNLGLLGKVFFIKSDLFENIDKEVVSQVDIIVANPPYIPTNLIENLQIEVKDFEPKEALDGGKDGLGFYRRIIRDSSEYLKSGGFLVFEIGDGQSERIIKLLKDNNCFEKIQLSKDYAGKERIISAVYRNQQL
ncbi:MAG: peptide chain release factor N(5)-glutamine methyltransferase [Actinobacteria bacterium]|nr:peptide chain release factor N(5)-glutamine methyltransferase [Actinomycetota bacterium]